MNTISNNSTAEINSIELNGKERVNQFEKNNNEEHLKTDTSKEITKADNTVITYKQMELVAQQLQDFIGKMNKGLEFSVDQDSGRDVIKVIDKNNGDLIKQYPTEEVLDLVSKLSDVTGSFINEAV